MRPNPLQLTGQPRHLASQRIVFRQQRVHIAGDARVRTITARPVTWIKTHSEGKQQCSAPIVEPQTGTRQTCRSEHKKIAPNRGESKGSRQSPSPGLNAPHLVMSLRSYRSYSRCGVDQF